MSEENQELGEENSLNSKYEGSVITVLNLSLVTFLILLGLSMVSPILPTYAESFQVSYTLVGFVVSSFAVTRMVLDMPAGLLSRRFDKKKIMISGLVLLSVSSVLAGLAPNYITLVIARMIEGAGSALYVTTATVFLAQISGEEKRGQWMSLYMGMLLLGAIFGPTFGGIIADIYDIRAPFFAYAIITGVAVLPTLALPKLTNSGNGSLALEPREILRDMRQVLSNPSFLLVTFAVFTMFLLRTGVRSTLVPLFAANNLGMDSISIGLVLTIGGITTALTITPMGSISDRIGRKIPLALCLVLTAVITLLIPFSTDLFTLSIAIAIYGAVIGLSGPSAAYVTDLSPQDKLEISMGLYRTISDSGFVVGPLLLGFLADITATPVAGATHSGLIGMFPFVVASIILIVAFFVLLRADDPVKDRVQNEYT
ncbi:MAG: Inner membrane transport protein YajR [Candidatus Thorarchaeota archaeon AB_25]|nr:MAG: Inner membrane transport protein YajR [Candidatus Thorarchaeota archaeon AB_25]